MGSPLCFLIGTNGEFIYFVGGNPLSDLERLGLDDDDDEAGGKGVVRLHPQTMELESLNVLNFKKELKYAALFMWLICIERISLGEKLGKGLLKMRLSVLIFNFLILYKIIGI